MTGILVFPFKFFVTIMMVDGIATSNDFEGTSLGRSKIHDEESAGAKLESSPSGQLPFMSVPSITGRCDKRG